MNNRNNNFWLGALLIGILLSAPENTLIRIVGDDLSTPMMTMLRYAVAAIFAMPFMIVGLKKRRVSIKRLFLMMLIAIPLALDPLISQYVVATTSASFQAVLSLAAPVIFVIVSTLITKDRLSRNKVIGFLFAILGGLVMIVLPNLNGTTTANFGAVPVLLMLVQCVCIAVEAIIWRRENERGTPLIIILGTFYLVWAVIAAFMAYALGDMGQMHSLTTNDFLIVVYLGIVASIMYNAVFTKFYSRVGTTTAATMKYLKKALSIMVPIILLGETLSWEIASGAALIIIGTIFAQSKDKRQKR